ncbi:hypothetical protein PybrP1_005823 [[Pythium] brassicae (nom. inval.)]|nr:hypothetical protein PybrP1_005823 [[Pythium] brassicae (nom. inval.)]
MDIVQSVVMVAANAAFPGSGHRDIEEDVEEFKYVVDLLSRVRQSKLTKVLQDLVLKFEHEVLQHEAGLSFESEVQNDAVVNVIREKLYSSSSAAVKSEVRNLPRSFFAEEQVEMNDTPAGLLGSGGDATAYEDLLVAKSKPITVAVKVLNAQSGRMAEKAKKEFIAKMALWGRLRHRNHCQLYGAPCHLTKTPFIVMELCDLGSLNGFLRSHEAHRMTRKKGSGERVEDLLAASVGVKITGALGWLAPECTQGKLPSPASDVYAFGMTIYQALTGNMPYLDVPHDQLIVKYKLEHRMPVSYGTCQWFHLHDLKNREPVDETSPKYLLSSVPQYLVSFLLLYYASTFRKPRSAIRHQLVIDSFVHRTLAVLLQAAVLHSTAHMSLSLCCTVPALCPVKPYACKLANIIRCPERVQHLSHFDLLPRLAQCLATYALALAMASVRVAHRMQALDARRHRAKFVSFQRRTAALPASAAV